MFTKSLYTDFTIHVGGESIATHRGILATHSSVFAAMLDKPTMVEAREKSVTITDATPAAVRFIYQRPKNTPFSGQIDDFLLLHWPIRQSNHRQSCDGGAHCGREVCHRSVEEPHRS